MNDDEMMENVPSNPKQPGTGRTHNKRGAPNALSQTVDPADVLKAKRAKENDSEVGSDVSSNGVAYAESDRSDPEFVSQQAPQPVTIQGLMFAMNVLEDKKSWSRDRSETEIGALLAKDDWGSDTDNLIAFLALYDLLPKRYADEAGIKIEHYKKLLEPQHLTAELLSMFNKSSYPDKEKIFPENFMWQIPQLAPHLMPLVPSSQLTADFMELARKTPQAKLKKIQIEGVPPKYLTVSYLQLVSDQVRRFLTPGQIAALPSKELRDLIPLLPPAQRNMLTRPQIEGMPSADVKDVLRWLSNKILSYVTDQQKADIGDAPESKEAGLNNEKTVRNFDLKKINAAWLVQETEHVPSKKFHLEGYSSAQIDSLLAKDWGTVEHNLMAFVTLNYLLPQRFEHKIGEKIEYYRKLLKPQDLSADLVFVIDNSAGPYRNIILTEDFMSKVPSEQLTDELLAFMHKDQRAMITTDQIKGVPPAHLTTNFLLYTSKDHANALLPEQIQGVLPENITADFLGLLPEEKRDMITRIQIEGVPEENIDYKFFFLLSNNQLRMTTKSQIQIVSSDELTSDMSHQIFTLGREDGVDAEVESISDAGAGEGEGEGASAGDNEDDNIKTLLETLPMSRRAMLSEPQIRGIDKNKVPDVIDLLSPAQLKMLTDDQTSGLTPEDKERLQFRINIENPEEEMLPNKQHRLDRINYILALNRVDKAMDLAPKLSIAIQPWISPAMTEVERESMISSYEMLNSKQDANALGAVFYLLEGAPKTELSSNANGVTSLLPRVIDPQYEGPRETLFLQARFMLGRCIELVTNGFVELQKFGHDLDVEALKIKTIGQHFNYGKEQFSIRSIRSIGRIRAIKGRLDGHEFPSGTKNKDEEVQVAQFLLTNLRDAYGLSSVPAKMSFETLTRTEYRMSDEDVNNTREIVDILIDKSHENNEALAELVSAANVILKTAGKPPLPENSSFHTLVDEVARNLELFRKALRNNVRSDEAQPGLPNLKHIADELQAIEDPMHVDRKKRTVAMEKILSELKLAINALWPPGKPRDAEAQAEYLSAYRAHNFIEKEWKKADEPIESEQVVASFLQQRQRKPRKLTELVGDANNALTEDDRPLLRERDTRFDTLVDYLCTKHEPWRKFVWAEILTESQRSELTPAQAAWHTVVAVISDASPERRPENKCELQERYDNAFEAEKLAGERYHAAAEGKHFDAIIRRITEEYVGFRIAMEKKPPEEQFDVDNCNWEPFGRRSEGAQYTLLTEWGGISCLKVVGGQNKTATAVDTNMLRERLGLDRNAPLPELKKPFALPPLNRASKKLGAKSHHSPK